MAGPWEKYAAVPPSVPERKGLFTTRDTAGNVSLGGTIGDIFGELAGGGAAVGEVARGAPVTTDTIDRVMPLAAAAIPVNPAVRAGDAAIPGMVRNMVRQEAPVPSAEALKAAGGAGFDAARDMGVDYSTRAVSQMASELSANLEGDGVLEVLAPKSFHIINQLAHPPSGAGISISGLHAARRALGNAAKDFNNPTEQLASQRAIEAIDGFITQPPAQGVVAGPAAAAGETFNAARSNYAAGMRSDRLTGVEDAADLRSAAANSGRNLDNTIRQRIASLLLNQKARAGFSPEEIAAIERISLGTPGRNTLRYTGNLLGGGGGLGQAMTSMGGAALGGSAAGIPGAIAGSAAPAVGAIAKALANRATRRALHSADEMVRRRSPLHEEQSTAAPMIAAPVAAREAALKAILFALQERSRHEGGGGY